MNQMTQINSQNRLLSIDILRGIIIILMALDHTRDFFGAASFSPTDLSQTDAAWFFTRWITHFCAPLFILLTGISAFLYLQKCQSKSQLRNFLLSRGVWMLVVEVVIINISWQFDYNFTFVQVIWVIGWSMILLAGLIYLSDRWILAISLTMVLLHNLLNDSAILTAMGGYDWIWRLLHQPSGFQLFDGGWFVYVSYALIPWPGVIGLGYVMGRWFLLSADERTKLLLHSGIACCVAFVVLRIVGWYGDPTVWSEVEHFGHQLLAFFKTAKYPPSLQFLLMTIGPGLLVLAWLDRINQHSASYAIWRYAHVFGAVPMFFYLLHVPVINAASQFYSYLVYGKAVLFFYGPSVYPENYQPSLLLTYFAWVVLLIVLYFPCKYYGSVKKASKNPVFSYI